MKKLFIISFSFLCITLALLSSINFLFDYAESIISDKAVIIIEKPDNLSNAAFLESINSAFKSHNMDIMICYVENNKGKSNFIYYKTNHTTDFVEINTTPDFGGLTANNCVSTYSFEEYDTYSLKAPSNWQDITFFSWENAEKLDLTNNKYYVSDTQKELAMTVIQQLDYHVTLKEFSIISGKLPTLFFSVVSIALLIASMIFYTFAIGRTVIIKKMDGYNNRNILWDRSFN